MYVTNIKLFMNVQQVKNDTIWKNRDLEAQLDKKNKIIQEIREVLENYPEIPDSSKIKGDYKYGT